MPAERHATIIPDSEMAKAESRIRTQAENMKTVRLIDFRQDANVSRPPDYHLHVYNIVPRAFEIRRPPNFPLIKLAACPVGQPYAKVAIIPNIVNEKWTDADSGETRVRGIPGERFATDLLNPCNLGIDCFQEINDEAASWIDGGSDDKTRRGVFWTVNDPPTPAELALAKERLEKHYRKLLVEADDLDINQNRKGIGMEHHLAADYFKYRKPWHQIAELPELCPNCAEAITKGVAYHRNSMGERCVIDWKRTLASGIIKKSDVPESERWWTEAKTA